MALALCGVRTNDAGMELDSHGTGLFPIACYHEDLSRDPVPWHWHFDWELGVILQGRAAMAAGNRRITLQTGEGFFLPSGVLHSLHSQDGEACLLHSAVFHPRLVGGSRDSIFWQLCVQPLLEEDGCSLVYLDRSRPWHGAVLDHLQTAWAACAEESFGYELQVRAALSQAALLLARDRPAAVPLSPRARREEERVKGMLQYIQTHFEEKITIAQIARSASVSESECMRCFRNTIGVTPIQYLKQFRVQRAAQLLAETPADIAEVGALAGFPDPSYFGKSFREMMGCTPLQYRRAHRRSTDSAAPP